MDFHVCPLTICTHLAAGGVQATHEDSMSPGASMVFGAAAGLIAASLTFPIEVTR